MAGAFPIKIWRRTLLNEYERQNAEAIRVVEEEKGSPYLS